MQALPMTTPSVVKNARTLFAQRASSATIQVSLRSIMKIPADLNKLVGKTRTRRAGLPIIPQLPLFPLLPFLLSFPLHPLQFLFHFLVVRIEGEGKPVLFRRLGKSSQIGRAS